MPAYRGRGRGTNSRGTQTRGGRGGRGRGVSRGTNTFRPVQTSASRIQSAYRNRRANRAIIQPFTETKKYPGVASPALRTAGALTLQVGAAFNSIVPIEYMYRKQGTAEDEMVGDSVYGRFLTTKLQIGFPQGINNIIWPTTLHVYFITVFQELNLTPFTTPSRS